MWVIVNIRTGEKLASQFRDFLEAVNYRNEMRLDAKDWTVISLDTYNREWS